MDMVMPLDGTYSNKIQEKEERRVTRWHSTKLNID
jgi:hypothetical protein